MLVSVLQWHAGIGNFYKCTHPLIKVKCSSLFNLDLRKILTIFFCSPSKKHRPLTCCHWNVNSLTAHKMLKKSLVEAYNTSHKSDFIFISETYLDSTVAADDKDLAIEGYNLVCADHPNDLKKGSVCIYYNESLAIQLINVNHLSECLLCGITFDNTKGYIAVLYRSSSQTSSTVNYFLLNFEKKCYKKLVLLNQIFQLFLVILMLDRNHGGKVILIHLKILKLMQSPLHMVYSN